MPVFNYLTTTKVHRCFDNCAGHRNTCESNVDIAPTTLTRGGVYNQMSTNGQKRIVIIVKYHYFTSFRKGHSGSCPDA